MPLSVGIERRRLAKPFAISRGVRTEAVTVVVLLGEGDAVGRGEATPYARYGETPEGVADAIEAARDLICDATRTPAARRAALQSALPAGAARNALDCALWDLDAKLSGRSVADLAAIADAPAEAVTAYTLGIDTPEAMRAAAAEAVATLGAPLLKAKVGGGDESEEAARLRAVREGAPDAQVIVDANEGWTPGLLAALDPVAAEIGALFIEQPLPAAEDGALDGLSLTTPLCADESCHTAADLPALHGRYGVVNIKLDKTGGLTGALALREEARTAGFDIMIGCMVAGSLAMAPAQLITGGALAVDLDGPLLLAEDHDSPLRYEGARVFAPSPALWG